MELEEKVAQKVTLGHCLGLDAVTEKRVL